MAGNSQLLVKQMKMTLQRRQGRTGKEAAGGKERKGFLRRQESMGSTAWMEGLPSLTGGGDAAPSCHRKERGKIRHTHPHDRLVKHDCPYFS